MTAGSRAPSGLQPEGHLDSAIAESPVRLAFAGVDQARRFTSRGLRVLPRCSRGLSEATGPLSGGAAPRVLRVLASWTRSAPWWVPRPCAKALWALGCRSNCRRHGSVLPLPTPVQVDQDRGTLLLGPDYWERCRAPVSGTASSPQTRWCISCDSLRSSWPDPAVSTALPWRSPDFMECPGRERGKSRASTARRENQLNGGVNHQICAVLARLPLTNRLTSQ